MNVDNNRRKFTWHKDDVVFLDDEAFDEFKESDHPRVTSGEHGGEFTSGSGGGSKQRVTKASAHLVPAPADRTKWPKHIQGLRIPAAWTDLHISPDPKAPLQVTGRDDKGRKQPIYLASHRTSKDAKKFARVKRLDGKYDLVMNQINKGLQSRDTITREHAAVTRLIMEVGLRPGSERDTGAEYESFGATTLKAEHVISDKNGVKLVFVPGKKHGNEVELPPVSDAAIAKDLVERAKKGGQLFPSVTDGSLRKYIGQLDGKGFLTKDLRTLKGTSEAKDLVAIMPIPTNAKEYKKAVKAVAMHVSKILGNTPTIALKSYISPVVFAAWKEASGG